MNPKECMFLVEILFLLSHFLSYIIGFDIKIIHQRIKPHPRMHHVVIIVVLTLWCSIISHATIIFFYHKYMITLQSSSISRAL